MKSTIKIIILSTLTFAYVSIFAQKIHHAVNNQSKWAGEVSGINFKGEEGKEQMTLTLNKMPNNLIKGVISWNFISLKDKHSYSGSEKVIGITPSPQKIYLVDINDSGYSIIEKINAKTLKFSYLESGDKAVATTGFLKLIINKHH